ncbi:unnamed protein product [Brassica rapa subsp. trilocularis]
MFAAEIFFGVNIWIVDVDLALLALQNDDEDLVF